MFNTRYDNEPMMNKYETNMPEYITKDDPGLRIGPSVSIQQQVQINMELIAQLEKTIINLHKRITPIIANGDALGVMEKNIAQETEYNRTSPLYIQLHEQERMIKACIGMLGDTISAVQL